MSQINMAAKCLTPIVSYPTGLVTDKADEQWRQLGSPDLRGGGVGDDHKALSTCLANPPQAIRAQIKELWHLHKDGRKIIQHYRWNTHGFQVRA